MTFDFSDYDRTIIGFHGTTVEAADEFVSGKPFNLSENDDDWFGKGIYFWEYGHRQAWWWTRKFKKHSKPAVVGAVIRLGNCLDLLDPGNVKLLKEFQASLMEKLGEASVELPTNERHHRNLDCAVFNYLYRQSDLSDCSIDSARAAYVPTDEKKRIWKGSWIYDGAQIQVCVRNPKNILGVWHVGHDGRYGKSAT